MEAEELIVGYPFREHVRASLGYYLRTQAIPWYDLATGSRSNCSLDGLVPGIVIRPEEMAYEDAAQEDLRGDTGAGPYATWLHRIPLPETDYYGGTVRDADMWEINVRIGQRRKIWEYDRVADWLKGFLRYMQAMPVFFWHYNAAWTPPVSRGDQIATGRISQVIVADRMDVALSRGDDGWVVATFRIDVMQPGTEADEL